MAGRQLGSIDDFLGHKTSNSGKFAKRLDKWKESGQIDLYLHPRMYPTVIWAHSFPRLLETKGSGGGGKERHIWTLPHTCWEEEQVLLNQYRRDEDGLREQPPQICPICLFIEEVMLLVHSGQIGWTEVVLRAIAEDCEDKVIIRAAGMWNGYDDKRLSRVEKDRGLKAGSLIKEAKDAGIVIKEAFKQNLQPKAGYLLGVINPASLGDGVMVTTEASSLGDAVKRAIRNEMQRRRDPDKGNPYKNPYPIRWTYNEKEPEFGKKYDAVALEAEPISPSLKKVLESPAPDIRQYTDSFDAVIFRSYLEKIWVHKVKPDFDKICAKAIAKQREIAKQKDETTSDSSSTSSAFDEESRRETSHRTPEVSTAKEEDDDVACDQCEGTMKASASNCPHCGQSYDVEPEPPPPPKEIKKRSAVAAPKKVDPPKARSAPVEVADEDDDDEEDDVPF